MASVGGSVISSDTLLFLFARTNPDSSLDGRNAWTNILSVVKCLALVLRARAKFMNSVYRFCDAWACREASWEHFERQKKASYTSLFTAHAKRQVFRALVGSLDKTIKFSQPSIEKTQGECWEKWKMNRSSPYLLPIPPGHKWQEKDATDVRQICLRTYLLTEWDCL